MIAPARWIGGSAEGAASLGQRSALAGAMLAACIIAQPAHAQVSASIDVESDYRLRGYSLSSGRPVATAQVGYDDDSGIYLNLSATGMLGRDDPLFLGVQGNIGYAKRLSRRVSIDGGVLRSQYRAPDPTTRSHNYTDIYLGVIADPVSARVYYSPDYYRPGVSTLYGEVEGTVRPAKNWRLNAHLGSLVYLRTPAVYFPGREARYDWRLGVSRQFGNLDLHAALSGGGPGREYYSGGLHGKTALTAGASWSF